MRIERIDGGFVQYYESNVIEKIAFLDTCTIYFHNKPPKELSNVDFGIAYNSQYGIPVSEDGSKYSSVVGNGKKDLGRMISKRTHCSGK